MSDHQCEQSGTVGRWFRNGSPETMICAGLSNGNTCRGDSGGPLICIEDNQPMLAGITSWGHAQCSQKSAPGVFTEIGNSKIHSFIMKHRDATSKYNTVFYPAHTTSFIKLRFKGNPPPSLLRRQKGDTQQRMLSTETMPHSGIVSPVHNRQH